MRKGATFTGTVAMKCSLCTLTAGRSSAWLCSVFLAIIAMLVLLERMLAGLAADMLGA